MTDDSSAGPLLAHASVVLGSPSPTVVGNSARLAAFLARQAVEELIDQRCEQLCGVPVNTDNTRAKLSILKSLDTSPTGRTLISAWYRLTAFCHQHAYQLSPTTSEVRAECEAVARDCLGTANETVLQ